MTNSFYINRENLELLQNKIGNEPEILHVMNSSTYEEDWFDWTSCDPTNSAFNCTIEEFLIYVRGPKTLPFSTALLVTIFFVGILVTGVFGNLAVCIVIIKQSAMHTATNYYLFSLAISDALLLIMGLPYEISLYWHQYPFGMGLAFCKARAFISEASTYVSVLTIVAFSMERFLAICHPLYLYTMSGFKRALRIITILWIVSFLSAIPFAIFTKIDYIKYPLDNSTILESAFCAMLDNPPGIPLWELSSCIFFVIPMFLIIVLYYKMGYSIRSRSRDSQALGVQKGSTQKESRHQQSRKAIIRMLATVVIAFFICWAPFHIQRLMYLYIRDWQYYQDVNTWVFSIAGWFYYMSCTINPILYNVMSHRYRVAFKETLFCWKRRKYSSRRAQSSFHETTLATNICVDNSLLLRTGSLRTSIYTKKESAVKNNLWRNKSMYQQNNLSQNADSSKNLVVQTDDKIDDPTKALSGIQAQETLLDKNESSI